MRRCNELTSACAVDPGRSSQSSGRPSKIIVLASNALWMIAHVRTLCGPRSRAFAAKRTATGDSRREIMRMLQRYLARELYPLIIDALRAAAVVGLT